jgi:pimeloyl-ACP methyl ester carboxylesterase
VKTHFLFRRHNRVLGAFQHWADVWVRSGWRVQIHYRTGAARILDPGNAIVNIGDEQECLETAARMAPSSGLPKAAILLHGLGHHPGGMDRLTETLGRAGWAVANVGYPSLRRPVEDHAIAASRIARAMVEDGAETVSMVGHSLGGLVARSAMARACADGWKPGRLVLIGSPARGAAIADVLKSVTAYQMLTGSCGQAVTAAGAANVPLPECEGILIVAGGNGARGFNPLLRGDNDGIVSVHETHLLGGVESDLVLVPSIHSSLAGHPMAVAAAHGFLETGSVPDLEHHTIERSLPWRYFAARRRIW